MVGARPQRQVRCRICNVTIVYRRDRMFAYFGYRPLGGPGNYGIQICRLLSARVRRLFVDCGGEVPRREPDDVHDIGLGGDGVPDPVIPQAPDNEGARANDGPAMQEPDMAPQGSPPREMRQVNLVQGFNASTKLRLDKVWATAFYEANIPFNVIKHPAFINAVRETVRARFPAYLPPSMNAIRTKLLSARKAEMVRQVRELTGNSTEKYGVTICADGWDNVQSRPLLNVIQSGTRGDVFLGTIDTTGHYKDSDYIASQIRPFVERAGPQHVVQVCTDNAPNMLGSSRMLETRYPHIYVQGCAAHCLDLLLEDWGKQDWVKHIVRKARLICLWVRNHHSSMALFRRMCPNLTIRLPVETRFATNFIMIERLVELRNAFERMVIDPAFAGILATYPDVNSSAGKRVRLFRKYVRADGFWNTCHNFLYMVIPVVKALRLFDGKAPAMGLAWRAMYDLKNHVRSFSSHPFRLNADLAADAMVAFDHRWAMMLTDLHWAGAMLNPTLRGWAPLHNHEESRIILNRVFRKLSSNEENYVQILVQYQDFLENRGAFADSTDPQAHGTAIHEWWDAMGGGARALQTIARRILGQVCSVSACERNWSMYSYVHSKVRNRLKHVRAEDLVYIYTNSRLVRHRRAPRPAQWYGLEEVHSDDDLDGEDPNEDDEEEDVGQGGDHVADDVADDARMDGVGQGGLGMGGVGLADDDPPESDFEESGSDDAGSDGDDGGDVRIAELFHNMFDAGHRRDAVEDILRQDSRVGRQAYAGGERRVQSPINAAEIQSDRGDGSPARRIPIVDTDFSQPWSDSLSFGQRDFDENLANMEGEIRTVFQEDLPPINRRRDEITEEDSRRRMADQEVQTPSEEIRRPITRSLASTSGSMAVNQQQPASALLSTPVGRGHILPQQTSGRGRRRRAVGSAVTNGSQSVVLTASSSRSRPVRRGVPSTSIRDPAARASSCTTGERVSSGPARGSVIQRTTRGVKRKKRFQGTASRFAPYEPDNSEGRPELDENGIRDPQGSRPTKKLVITRDDELRLSTRSPRSDDDMSTDESEEDRRCDEANDPTVRIRE